MILALGQVKKNPCALTKIKVPYLSMANKRPLTASEMASKRWKGTTPEQRSEHARRMNTARWSKKGRKKPEAA